MARPTPRVSVVTVRVEQVAIDTGLWCRTCLLSSGVRVWFTATIGVAMSLRSATRCCDCGGDEINDAP